MAKNVQDLQAKMSPESRARSEAKAERLIREMALDELRAARALTQEHLSTILGVKQSAISKLECRADMYVSTLPQTAPEPVMVAQALAERETCINPKTGLPDHLVQCVVSPCLAFEPSSPFATCIDNYCGGCHAILCGVLLEDVAGGLLSTQ
jgi:hypothetical protein